MENIEPGQTDSLQAMYEHGEGLLLSSVPYPHRLQRMPELQVHRILVGLVSDVPCMIHNIILNRVNAVSTKWGPYTVLSKQPCKLNFITLQV